MTEIFAPVRHIARAIKFRLLLVRRCYYAAKIIAKFPEERWVSFTEIVEMGCPERDAKIVLGALVDLEYLEPRLTLLRELAALPDSPELRKVMRMVRQLFIFQPGLEAAFDYKRIHRPPAPDIGKYEPLPFFP